MSLRLSGPRLLDELGCAGIEIAALDNHRHDVDRIRVMSTDGHVRSRSPRRLWAVDNELALVEIRGRPRHRALHVLHAVAISAALGSHARTHPSRIRQRNPPVVRPCQLHDPQQQDNKDWNRDRELRKRLPPPTTQTPTNTTPGPRSP